jgi:hypothetical protein
VARATRLLRDPQPPKLLTYRQAAATIAEFSHYRVRYVVPPYKVPMNQWPQAIVQPWQAYRAEKSFDIRETTLAKYEELLSSYVSFGLRCDHPPVAWSRPRRAATGDQLSDGTHHSPLVAGAASTTLRDRNGHAAPRRVCAAASALSG